MAYTTELRLALRAVHRASLLTKSVLSSLSNNVSAETKADDSPVTIADFAAQALLISALHAVYPQDAFLGEESADALRQNEQLADRVWQLVQQAKEETHAGLDANGQGEENAHVRGKEEEQALAFPTNKEHMFELIDRGGKGQVTGSGRVWVMDPVDGTATFMQGQQYAVCLCLLVDGVQQVGVIACPNLAFPVQGKLGETSIHEDKVDKDGFGVVLSAVKGQGTFIRTMGAKGLGAEARHVDLTTLPSKNPSELNFVEATIGKTSLSQPEHNAVATSLGASWPGTVLWSQQMKYVALTLGATDVMVRIPKTLDRFTYVWDHAGGHLLFQEAGGMISDFKGEQIDFANGRKIKGERNWGMIACMPGLFEQVGRAVMDVLKKRDS
ncbi:3'(2'),5'-bisphosphate nucleotidase [Stemphylium lycopersici]|uniref:3'(2'),5'-bisphosphate nucleotidase n=1 Tax=Stemphylium lycopersici TaxID=183478 RepID=A0A364NC67_STELY|nr:3'(2'),5'-bisphosphate nucleotidase [Stemphylium lycopersici]RAR11610.1 3'(2'),5'-bisphosphate nucleotidase [Stemphylium lycopersici]RAR14787.1 3'(2'),5'-bisphosphate nucleotidase [Stemphylium lycopersici]